ncbi:MAG: hypothetical protein ACK5NT_03785 [Pyrinomonadaceae bacterium]
MFKRLMYKRMIFQNLLTLALCAIAFTISGLGQTQTSAELAVTGAVTVNGERAVNASSIVSNSQITTGSNSNAVISLGPKGKLEVTPNSDVTLRFTDTNFVMILRDGKVRVMNNAGTGATVTTKSATVVADTGQSNSFVVSLGCEEDEKCRETFVEVFSGLVTMNVENREPQQLPAGTSAASGNNCSAVCKRASPVLPIALSPGINPGLIALVLGGIGAAVVTAVVVGGGGGGGDNTPGGTTPVVSPIS